MPQLRRAPFGVAIEDVLPGAQRLGPPSRRVASCTADWQAVEPGDVFVAVDDVSGDGHETARRAVQRGAVAVVGERHVPVGVPVYLVDDSRVALGELCQALAGYPAQQLTVIGVAGTHGKTTTIALLESILAAAGRESCVANSLKTYDGVSWGPGVGKALQPIALAERLARADAAGCSCALLELSSQTLAEARLSGIQLDTLCVTHVDSGRLDLHQTTENYRQAVRRAFDHLADDGVAVLNADDPVSCRWLSECQFPSLSYGRGEQAQVVAEIIQQNANETVFVLTAGNESAAVRTRLIGAHFVDNCLAAATVALAHGVDLQTIAAGIEACDPPPARMQRIDCGQDFAVFIDAANTAESLRSALRTARSLAAGRVICVLGDQLPDSRNETLAIQNVVDRLADLSIVTERLTYGNQAWALTDPAAPKLHVVADRAEALGWATSIAASGDVVVIAGSRSRTECGFGGGPASDADMVGELLYARVYAQPALRLVA